MLIILWFQLYLSASSFMVFVKITFSRIFKDEANDAIKTICFLYTFHFNEHYFCGSTTHNKEMAKKLVSFKQTQFFLLYNL